MNAGICGFKITGLHGHESLDLIVGKSHIITKLI